MTFSRLGHRRLATGVFLHLDRCHLIDATGKPVARDVIRHPGGVAVLPVSGEDIWLVSQFRTAIGADVLEIPAGKIDPSDRDLELAARRELAEEIGAEAIRVAHLTTMWPAPGYTDEAVHIFVATDLSFGQRRPDGAEERQAEVVRYTMGEALRRIDSGEISDAKTQIGLLLWDRKRREL